MFQHALLVYTSTAASKQEDLSTYEPQLLDVSSFEALPEDASCNIHKKPLEYSCKTCKTQEENLLCAECTASSHHGHKQVKLSTVSKQAYNELLEKFKALYTYHKSNAYKLIQQEEEEIQVVIKEIEEFTAAHRLKPLYTRYEEAVQECFNKNAAWKNCEANLFKNWKQLQTLSNQLFTLEMIEKEQLKQSASFSNLQFATAATFARLSSLFNLLASKDFTSNSNNNSGIIYPNIQRSYSVPVRYMPCGIACNSVKNEVYVANNTSEISIHDLATGQLKSVLSNFSFNSNHICGMVVLEESQELIVSNYNAQQISVIDLTTQKLKRQFLVEGNLYGIALYKDQNEELLICCAYNTKVVFLYDFVTGALRSSFNCQGNPTGAAVIDNNIYIGQYNPSIVSVYSISGKLQFEIGNQNGHATFAQNWLNLSTSKSRGAADTQETVLLVTDMSHNSVQVCSKTGQYLYEFGLLQGLILNCPFGAAMCKNTLCIADYSNYAIQFVETKK